MPNVILGLLGLLGIGVPQESERRGDEWSYHAPPVAAETRARDRVLLFEPGCPDDLVEIVEFDGSSPRYAQLRFGSLDSTRVAVVLDVHEGGATLYVDADRDRIIGEQDRVEGTEADGGFRWSCELEAVETASSEAGRACSVGFRLGRSGRALSYATEGYLEGVVGLGDRSLAARRVDGDGNGRFADPQDRLWLDLDGDGRFDRVDEQFLFASFLHLEGERYALRSDPAGRFLRLQPVVGEGRVRCALKLGEAGASVQRLELSLVAEDGSAFRLSQHDVASTLPVGRYQVGMLSMALRDGGGRSSEFVFSRDPRAGAPVGIELKDGEELRFDPLGALRFESLAAEGGVTPGELLRVQPLLTSATGLLINTCSRPGALVELRDREGVRRDSFQSGFA